MTNCGIWLQPASISCRGEKICFYVALFITFSIYVVNNSGIHFVDGWVSYIYIHMHIFIYIYKQLTLTMYND